MEEVGAEKVDYLPVVKWITHRRIVLGVGFVVGQQIAFFSIDKTERRPVLASHQGVIVR